MANDNFAFHIVGAGRGGTSLLAGLLDHHSRLEVGFEQYAIACLMGKDLAFAGHSILEGRIAAYLGACKELANRHSGAIWGNKITTEQIFGLEDHNTANPEHRIDVLDRLFNVCTPEKKVVFILRDGRSCIRSKMERAGRPIELACERWLYSVKCYRFFRTNHANNICVRFEDLLAQPEETLAAICTFLSIGYEKSMLGGTNNSKMRPEYRKDGIDASRSIPPVIPEPYMDRIRDEMEYCGYL